MKSKARGSILNHLGQMAWQLFKVLLWKCSIFNTSISINSSSRTVSIVPLLFDISPQSNEKWHNERWISISTLKGLGALPVMKTY